MSTYINLDHHLPIIVVILIEGVCHLLAVSFGWEIFLFHNRGVILCHKDGTDIIGSLNHIQLKLVYVGLPLTVGFFFVRDA